MAIPAYLWLKDDGGAAIKGSVDVDKREGSIEVLSFMHGLSIPSDNQNGKLTGTRIHSKWNLKRSLILPVLTFTKPLPQVRPWKVPK